MCVLSKVNVLDSCDPTSCDHSVPFVDGKIRGCFGRLPTRGSDTAAVHGVALFRSNVENMKLADEGKWPWIPVTEASAVAGSVRHDVPGYLLRGAVHQLGMTRCLLRGLERCIHGTAKLSVA